MMNRRIWLGTVCGLRNLSAQPAARVLPANRIEIRADGVVSPASIACWAGDQLSWRNTTPEAHELGVVNADGKFVGFFDAPLDPGQVSAVFTPSLRLNAEKKQEPYTLHYTCRLHPRERGTIIVNPVP
jgi:plastocyanin